MTESERRLENTVEAGTKRDPRTDAGPEWRVGDTLLDLYEVTGILGEGGMGRVYKLRHKTWKVDLAVKTPTAATLATMGGLSGFIREAQTWVSLGLHPHIVSCYYVRTIGGIPRVFAEFVGGGSLSDWIRTGKLYAQDAKKDPEPGKVLDRILDIAIQFAWGLDNAHEQGLVHQDVKPANVMLTAAGTAKVTDFGLAKARSVAAPSTATGGRESLLVSSGGMTPAYCSPEQFRGEALSRRTDIWSWGLSVLEMFTGGVVWGAGQAAPEVLAGYLESPERDRGQPEMPAALSGLLKRCFAREPENRPASMSEIADELREMYRVAIDAPYFRQVPGPIAVSAEALNNRALSFLDLEQPDDAEKAWAEALRADPSHAESTCNQCLWLWRQKKLSGQELTQRFKALRARHRGGGRDEHLIALIELERGEFRSAVSLLDDALDQEPANKEIEAALAQAKAHKAVPAPWQLSRLRPAITERTFSCGSLGSRPIDFARAFIGLLGLIVAGLVAILAVYILIFEHRLFKEALLVPLGLFVGIVLLMEEMQVVISPSGITVKRLLAFVLVTTAGVRFEEIARLGSRFRLSGRLSESRHYVWVQTSRGRTRHFWVSDSSALRMIEEATGKPLEEMHFRGQWRLRRKPLLELFWLPVAVAFCVPTWRVWRELTLSPASAVTADVAWPFFYAIMGSVAALVLTSSRRWSWRTVALWAIVGVTFYFHLVVRRRLGF